MIDWLRRASDDPSIAIGDRTLPIAVRRHARATRLTMRLAPDGSEVRVTLPRWGRTIDAVTFAEARREWLTRQLDRVPEARELSDGAQLWYRGEPVTVEWQAGAPRRVVPHGATLKVGGPAANLPARVQRWLEGEALRLCGEDLAHYCARIHHPLPELRLTRAQRRWGSCSGGTGPAEGRRIRINWRLAMAPDQVRRSVVAHEVAHLVHFDHSPAFHQLLEDLFEGDLAEADGWLKREGRSLYALFG